MRSGFSFASFSFAHPALRRAISLALPIAATLGLLTVLTGCGSGHGKGYLNPPLIGVATTPTPAPTVAPTPTPAPSATPVAGSRYTVAVITNNYAIEAKGFNDAGQITGVRRGAAYDGSDDRAFLYDNGTFKSLGGQVDAAYSSIDALSSNGILAGRYTTAGGARNAFVYQNGALRDLGTISVFGSVYGVNAKGQVVGTSTFGEKQENGEDSFTPRVFFYDGTSVRDVFGTPEGDRSTPVAINDAGQFIGTMGGKAFLYENGAIRDIGQLGSKGAIPYAINNKGQIVGQSQTSDGDDHAFIYENGTMRDLLPDTSKSSVATALNDSGQIVGQYYAFPILHAFVLTGGVLTDLNQYAPVPNKDCRALGINNKGQILMQVSDYDYGKNGDSFRLVVLTPSAK